MKRMNYGRNYIHLGCIALLVVAFVSINCSATFWHGYVALNNSSSWQIDRYSENIILRSIEASMGNITSLQITPQGRSVNGYYSRYANMKANDVVLKERTSANQGSLKYAEISNVRASIESDVIQSISKDNQSNTTFVEFNEYWPSQLQSRRHLFYSGSQINDRDYGGNNFDYVGTSFLYNTKLEKDRTYGMILLKMNVSVAATEEAFLQIDYLPTKTLLYSGKSYSTGMAGLKYGMASEDQRSLTKGIINYDVLGQQDYYGTTFMNLSMNISSRNLVLKYNDSWLYGLCNSCEPWVYYPPDYNIG
ncbi:MAG: hypothetical protein ACYDHX_07125 [Methanothrix sp.]